MKGIGIDIGGTNTKLVVMDSAGRVLREDRFRTQPERGRADFIRRLCAVAKKIKAECGARAVGVGVAGEVDPERGLVRFSPNLGRWRNLPIGGPLGRALGLPCVVENDANMAAWAAYELELGRKYPNVVAVTLGTGIGSGIIIDGRLYHGGAGAAGELGHNKLTRGGERCHCGGRGCMEAYCGSYAIMREARRAIKDTRAFVRKYAEPGRPRFNTGCLTRAANRGNRAALKIWRDMGENLGRGLADMLLVLNPDCVVLTGGVSKGARHFLGSVRKVFAAQEMTASFKSVKLVTARNADLGAYGAALFGMESARGKR